MLFRIYPPNVLMLVLMGFLGSRVCADGIVEISQPVSGTIVNVSTFLQAIVDPSVDRARIQSVPFEFSSDLSNWLEITGAVPEGIGEFTALWDTAKLTAGVYYLRAKLLDSSN